MKDALIGLSVLAVLVAGGVVAYLYIDSSTFASNGVQQASIAESEGIFATSSPVSGRRVTPEEISTPADPPEGYVQYVNQRYGFSFYYSPEGEVKEYDEGGGAMTVVLENKARVRGMQVFIVPYSEPTISEERFRMDVPSGVRTNVASAMLDGVEAVTFNSEDAQLGETREIWVIHNGHLYEITTFRGIGNWFIPIIQSWRFL